MGHVIFIFVRWSHHFISIYTTQFLLNTTSYSTSSLPILHLLPIDSSMTGSFNNMVLTYQQQILNPNITFSDDVSFDYRISINSLLFCFTKVIFILSELESVQLFQQALPSNLTSTNWSTLSGTITFDNTQQRSFIYSFIGLQCNGSWTQLKSVVNSVFTNLDTSLTTCINYPVGDIVITVDTGE
jgi:hypothetical protein